MISYEPLFKTMKKKGVTTYTLINTYKINPRTIHSLKKGLGITTYTIEKLCRILDCTPNDIFEVIKDDEAHM